MRPSFTTTALIDDAREVTRYDLGGHTHLKLDYHFVWRTKFNRKLLGPVLTPFLVDEIESDLPGPRRSSAWVWRSAVEPRPFMCPLTAQSIAGCRSWDRIKSITSKNAFEKFPEIAERTGEHELWGNGYHVESLGDKSVFAILAYIGRQDEKHDLQAMENYMASVDAFLNQSDENVDPAGQNLAECR